ncbi:hypothetical protein GCM10008018_14050 [Paenibacillus marchantiophytorum]|uniref:DUF1501 domain-containing protein n=1 Tax=Paenibacillus marchantiophytorum TaxID=1619310 RepID=A0ABQ2BTB7_9BACL|nr:DUF1501 domain-containing protein [Paenibacillus marchantiophytorum]GGI45823.1 hypothetical protein GCM10008018_14050 [Paenibacillus marchantiophytorum]
MKLTRRDFLMKGTAMFATLGLGEVLLPTSGPLFAQSAGGLIDEEKVLVVVQLDGGNDALNTLIPYGQGLYYDNRKTLAYKQSEVLTLNNQMGLHPKLVNLKRFYDTKKLAIVQGVGYPQPSRSHFRSTAIWQTAIPETISTSGWLARYVESSLTGNKNPLRAMQMAGKGAFESRTFRPGSIGGYEILAGDNRINQTFKEIYATPSNNIESLRVVCQYGRDAEQSSKAIQMMLGNYVAGVKYPDHGFAGTLQGITRLLAGKSGTRVFHTQLAGFDDHNNEKEQHAALLEVFDQSLGAFYEDLEKHGLANKVAVMVYSEFGRRVKENGNLGTDHGAAGLVFVLGGQVKGGLYGAYPSLSDLDEGDLKYQVDFRSVYSTILDSWLKGDTQSVLGRTYENLKFF